MELSHIFFLIVIAATAFMGLLTIPLCILTILSHIKLRDHIYKNHTHELLAKNIKIDEFAGPFHSYDSVLSKIDDPELQNINTNTAKIKRYFLLCFTGTVILIILCMTYSFFVFVLTKTNG